MEQIPNHCSIYCHHQEIILPGNLEQYHGQYCPRTAVPRSKNISIIFVFDNHCVRSLCTDSCTDVYPFIVYGCVYESRAYDCIRMCIRMCVQIRVRSLCTDLCIRIMNKRLYPIIVYTDLCIRITSIRLYTDVVFDHCIRITSIHLYTIVVYESCIRMCVRSLCTDSYPFIVFESNEQNSKTKIF